LPSATAHCCHLRLRPPFPVLLSPLPLLPSFSSKHVVSIRKEAQTQKNSKAERSRKRNKNAPIRILHPVPPTLDDIDIAAARPGAVGAVEGEHPDRGPELCGRQHDEGGEIREGKRKGEGRRGKEEEDNKNEIRIK
jgi:hypothetical protein